MRNSLLLLALVALSLVDLSTAAAPRLLCSLPSADRYKALPSATTTLISALPGAPYAQYAETAFSSYLSGMYDPTHNWLRLQYGVDAPSNYWNSAIAFHTLLQYADFHAASNSSKPPTTGVAQLVERLVHTQTTLLNESDARLRNFYNDDMSWMVHALTALYDHTHNDTYIAMAETLFDTVRQSDDTTCCGDMKGGVWWDVKATSKATAAQAGVALAAIRLRETGASTFNSTYLLDYAASHYSFWRQHMVNGSTGQVTDSINRNGQKNYWSFSYNEGLMIADAVHLYMATPTRRYLADLALLSGFLMRGVNVSVNGTRRTILANDATGGCEGDSSEFHQVGFQYLTEYYRLLTRMLSGPLMTQALLDQQCALYDFLEANVDSLWMNARDADKGTFNCNWDAPFRGRGKDGLQGAMNAALSALSLFANLPVLTVPQTQPQPRTAKMM